MISLKLSKDRFKNHYHYSRTWYIVALAVTLVVVNFAYNASEPDVPDWLKVDITIYGSYMDDSMVKDIEEDMLAVLPEDQKEVNIYSMSMDSSSGYSAYEVMAARMAAKEDDIIIVSKEMVTSYAEQGAFIELDDYITKEDIKNLPDEFEWELYMGVLETQYGGDGEEHLFGAPLDGATGLILVGFYPNDMAACIMSYSENIENAIKCVEYLISQVDTSIIVE